MLRHVHLDLGVTLGVNWYLARPENVDRPGNNDGEKRHHLKGGVWRSLDSDLFDKITRFAQPCDRRIANVAKWGVLPDSTSYHDANLCSAERDAWHNSAKEILEQSDLIFLDPDNGFEVPSMTRRTEPKYAYFAEAAEYLARGQTVVGIQFARQCDPVVRAGEVRSRLLEVCGDADAIPVVRGRVAPNILFVTVAPRHLTASVTNSLRKFCERSEKVELID